MTLLFNHGEQKYSRGEYRLKESINDTDSPSFHYKTVKEEKNIYLFKGMSIWLSLYLFLQFLEKDITKI